MWAKNSQRFAVLAAAALLGACEVGPDFVRPQAPAGAAYLRPQSLPASISAQGQTQTFGANATLSADWWRLFHSTQLDALVGQALSSNPSLQSAQASLRQSQDSLRAGYGIFYPQLGLDFDAARQRVSPFRLGLGGSGNIFNLFTLSSSISYALDLFGGERRTVEGLKAQLDIQHYTMLGTYMTLTGNVVNTAITRAAYTEEIRATGELITLQQQQLGLTETQATAGTAPYSAVLSVRSALAANQSLLPGLVQKRDQAEHLLAVLLGQTPGQGVIPSLRLDDLQLPADLPLSLPSALVRQRPDILAAEAQLHVSNAQIGVATAALFPSISLGGTYGVNNPKLDSLAAPGGSFWNLGPSISLPLFQGGALWYSRKAALEGYQKSLGDYRTTVLAAFEQVADTLKALQHDAEAVQAQTDALNTSEEALKLLQANYAAGLVGYLDVLNADEQYRQARLGYTQAEAQRYQDTVALFLALGGGWWNAPASNTGKPDAVAASAMQAGKP